MPLSFGLMRNEGINFTLLRIHALYVDHSFILNCIEKGLSSPTPDRARNVLITSSDEYLGRTPE